MCVGLNIELIRNIMVCVESPRMSILWNGQQTKWIQPRRGIRQGDAISLYNFVLCIERLSHMINNLAREVKCQTLEEGSYDLPYFLHRQYVTIF